jgi:hypothetical protein
VPVSPVAALTALVLAVGIAGVVGCSGGAADRAPASRFVSPGGSDAGDCTSASPCRTFDRGYQVAAPGDTVEIAAGTYPSQTLSAKAGAAPPNVVLRPAPGARVVVGDPGAETACIGFEGAQHVTLEGFETAYTNVGGMTHQCGVTVGRGGAHHIRLVDLDAGMIWFGADDVTVLGGDFGPSVDENMKIEHGTGHEPRRILIDGATIHDARSHERHMECVALWGGRGVTIRNTRIFNCETFHLWVVASENAIRDVLIEKNTFEQPDASVPTASTVKLGDHGGVLENVELRGNRILHDEVYVLQGFGEGGTGAIRILGNRVVEPIELGHGATCADDGILRPRRGVTYECRGNILVD